MKALKWIAIGWMMAGSLMGWSFGSEPKDSVNTARVSQKSADVANSPTWSVQEIHRENGVLTEVRHSRGAKLAGWSRRFYENGKVLEEVVMRDGKPAGRYRYYDPQGRLLIDARYWRGELDGRYRKLDPDSGGSAGGGVVPDGEAGG